MNDETNNPTSTLEEQIAQLTAWPSNDEPQTWRAALKIVKDRKTGTSAITDRVLRWPMVFSFSPFSPLARSRRIGSKFMAAAAS